MITQIGKKTVPILLLNCLCMAMAISYAQLDGMKDEFSLSLQKQQEEAAKRHKEEQERLQWRLKEAQERAKIWEGPVEQERKRQEQERARKLEEERKAEELKLKQELERQRLEELREQQELERARLEEQKEASDYGDNKIPDRLDLKKQQELERARLEKERKLITEEKLRLEEEQRLEEFKKQQQIIEKIGALYRSGIEQYDQGLYEAARVTFKQILDLDPAQERARDYVDRKIPERLKHAEEAKMQAEQERTKLKEMEKRFAELSAKEKLERQQLEELKEQQKLERGRLERVRTEQERKLAEEKLRLEEQRRLAELKLKQELKLKIDSLYKQAKDLYDQGQFTEAVNLFNQILILDPSQKEAADYLDNKIPSRRAFLEQERARKLEEERKAEELKKKEEERRLADEKVRLKEERRLITEEKLRLEEQRKAEELRKKQELERQRLEEFKKQQELERARLEGERKLAEEKRRQEELARLKEIKRKQDEEQVRLEELKKQRELEKARLEEERRLEEGKLRLKEEQHLEEFRKQQQIIENIGALYRSGIEQYDQGLYEAARVTFKQILDLDPAQERARDYVDRKIPERLKHAEEAKMQAEQERTKLKEMEKRFAELRAEKKKFEEEKEESKQKRAPEVKTEPQKPVAVKPRPKKASEDEMIAKAVEEAGEGEEYKVKAFDIISVKIYQEDDLSGDYRIQKGGFIDMPLLRKIQVEGMTVYEIEEKLTALLSKDYLINPQVMVSVREYHAEKIIVLGQVMKPGTYSLSAEEPITLLRAISMAGGFTNIAAINGVKIIRMEKGKKQTMVIKCSAIIDGKQEDVVLKPGDIIVVPESFW